MGTTLLVEFLAAMTELRQIGPVSFQAADGQPWVHLIMAACNSNGGYANDGAFLPQVNVVGLVRPCSGDPAWYDALAGRTAGFLGWSAFEDHEGRQVWPPLSKGTLNPALRWPRPRGRIFAAHLDR